MHADVVELVDTLALGASASGREGSSPFIRTIIKTRPFGRVFIMVLFGDFKPPPQACKVRTASGSSETEFSMKAVLSIVKSGVAERGQVLLFDYTKRSTSQRTTSLGI